MGTQRGKVGSSNGRFDFAKAGYVRADTPAKRRLIMSLGALEKGGKTHFALTAPGPICVINTDVGLDGVVQKFQDEKEVWVHDVRFSVQNFRQMKPEMAARKADEILVRVKSAYDQALGKARSIVIDNATELWELVRLSHFGKLEQVRPHHYVHPNNEYREIIRSAYDQDRTNLILIHKMKDEYANDQRTGEKKIAGFSDTPYMVQCNAICWRNGEQSVPDCFHMTIMDSRQNPELAGTDMSGHDLSFPQLARLVFPETKDGDWL